MGGAIHPLPQYAFMAWCLVKAQGQLYLFLLLAQKILEGERLVSWSTVMVENPNDGPKSRHFSTDNFM
jgi:hypothetical protein